MTLLEPDFGGLRKDPPPKRTKLPFWERLKLLVQPKRMMDLINLESRCEHSLTLGSGIGKDGVSFVIFDGYTTGPLKIEGDIWCRNLDMGGDVNVTGGLWMYDPREDPPYSGTLENIRPDAPSGWSVSNSTVTFTGSLTYQQEEEE